MFSLCLFMPHTWWQPTHNCSILKGLEPRNTGISLISVIQTSFILLKTCNISSPFVWFRKFKVRYKFLGENVGGIMEWRWRKPSKNFQSTCLPQTKLLEASYYWKSLLLWRIVLPPSLLFKNICWASTVYKLAHCQWRNNLYSFLRFLKSLVYLTGFTLYSSIMVSHLFSINSASLFSDHWFDHL